MAYDQTQEMFLLALSSHAGADCHDTDVIACVDNAIRTTLEKWSLTDWQIVWGPGVAFDPTSDHPTTDYPANVMYAAYRELDAKLCISISATNQKALYDLAEDFMVHELVRWPYAPAAVPDLLAPKISEGFSKALDLLRVVKPSKTQDSAEMPGFDQTLIEWLADFVSEHPNVSLITTGQSLGGVLAPIIALWLWETQQDWNPDKIVKPNQFSCVRFSAPTPGNREFAHYYNKRLPATTNVINTRDFAPKMFDEETMREIPTLYLPIKPGLRMTNVINEFRLAVTGKGYTQPGELARRSFEAPISDLPNDNDNECLMFTNQMGYHHLLAYFYGLGLEDQITAELSEAYNQFNSLCKRPVVDMLKS